MIFLQYADIVNHIKEAVFIPDHYTLMTDQFDHLPILWDKQRTHCLLFMAIYHTFGFQMLKLRSKKKLNSILLSNLKVKYNRTSVS